MTWAAKLAGAAVAALLASTAQADFAARVSRVVDGDTLEVTQAGRVVSLCLADIDAPEKDQPHGAKSRQALADLAFGREVWVREWNTRPECLVAFVFVDGSNINVRMVEQGYAWAYKPGVTRPTRLHELEAAARAARLGLWRDSAPISPWEWRTHR